MADSTGQWPLQTIISQDTPPQIRREIIVLPWKLHNLSIPYILVKEYAFLNLTNNPSSYNIRSYWI